MSIFKPRNSGIDKKQATAEPEDNLSYSSIAKQHTISTTQELTKNEHYCVSSLPALPSVFKTHSTSFINGYSDCESNYSLVINEDSIFVWSYKLTDSIPLSIEFPIDKSRFKLPMAILTRPSSGTGQDPGLIIIDGISGLVKFYESVQHAPSLGLINDKSLELNLPLKKNECIVVAENIEPSGIVIATNFNRCLLISLRDFKSKPQLGYLELLNNQSFLQKLFNNSSSNGETFDNDIVAIRSGKISNHGTCQEIIVLDSSGGFHLYTYNLFSANGSPYIDKKKSFKQYISIDVNEYPGMLLDQQLEFLDIWPIDQTTTNSTNDEEEDDDEAEEGERYYLALVNIQDDLYLITLKINRSGSLPIGSHKLKTAPSYDNTINKPRLYLPKPEKTAFVIIDNSIILTDLNISYLKESLSTKRSNSYYYYKPRWEDIIRFKSSVEFIGNGYENQSANSNPAIVLITKNFGVIRVEKFPESQDIDNEVVTDPLTVVKSHIEQAIFYSDIEEIDFDLIQRFDSEIITKAIQSIIQEILDSTSAYLPKTLPSISDLTSLKVKLYKTLIEYVERNGFNQSVIPQIVENLEKSDVAYQLWTIINETDSLKQVLQKQVGDLREFFTHKISNINQVLTQFIEELGKENLPVLQLIVNTLYQGVYLNDVKYIKNEIVKSWIFETHLIVRTQEIFTREFVVDSIGIDNTKSKDALKLVEVLYYFVNEAISYMKVTSSSTEDNKQLEDYQKWYNEIKYYWIEVLLQFDLIQESIEIGEKYQDFASLARILDYQKTIKNIPLEELNYIKYFEKFGYEFASCVYDYYLKNNQIQSLLLDFIDYKSYLLKYFNEKPIKTSNVSWIRYLLDSQFNQASDALITSAQKQPPLKLQDQQIKYSLAKLSAIAANDDKDNLNDINNQLLVIKYQKLTNNEIGRIEAIPKGTFIKSYINAKITKEYQNSSLIDQYYEKLVKNLQLSSIELINLLTTIKPSLLNKESFGYAFKTAQSIINQSLSDYYSALVLIRLLTIGDEDDDNIKDMNSSSDAKLREMATDSILFKTLTLDPNAISKLDQLLINPSLIQNDNDQYQDDLVIRQFNESLIMKLIERLNDNKFKLWVESVKEQARL